MSLTLAAALYFIIWWVVLFAVLPWGVRTQGDAGEVVQGTIESAPVKPPFLKIIATTTIVAAIVLLGVWYAMKVRLIPLDLANPG